MKNFEEYTHPELKSESVKLGFSWPAFFFTWIWGLIKRLYFYALALVIAIAVIIFVLDKWLGLNDLGIRYLYSICHICGAIKFGFSGNKWRVELLNKKGYKLKEKG